ncbi:response regulator transcription factor [Paenibacillus dakarensis]|uniref:response regulator transcription factor n=1 Tax=Paenibacillus dakarensis TaxID=1527293 RepID=UPI0006D57AEC|nr:response regulator [Paenibacillus dakarensis]
MKTILVVDDEPRTREGVRKTLEAWSSGQYHIETASSGVTALDWLQHHHADILLTDIRMPEIGGLELLERLNSLSHQPVVIIMSGHSEFDYARQGLRYGAVDYLLKPLDKRKMIEAVELALKRGDKLGRIEQMEKLVDPKLLEAVQQEKVCNVQVKEALRYLDDHLNETISLRDIADHLHLNSSYFSVLFKEQVGLTFSEYVTRRRVQRAKELLANTAYSITEIAEQVGYSTPKYFVKVFRDHENMSPGQYRHHVASDAQEKI